MDRPPRSFDLIGGAAVISSAFLSCRMMGKCSQVIIDQVRAPRENVNEKAGSNLPLDFSNGPGRSRCQQGDQPGFTWRL
jgi:hypothetical protein